MKNLAFLTLMFSSQAFGMPLDRPCAKPDCSKSRYEQQGELLQKISIMAQQDPVTGKYLIDRKTGKFIDPRGPITKKAEELHLSAQEIRRIRETCGYVYCGEPSKGAVESGAGCLISKNEIWTAKHVLDAGFSGKEKNCYIQNQANPYRRVELDLSTSGYQVMTSADQDWSKNELIVVRTKGTLTKTAPFALSTRSIEKNQTMILVSASQERMPMPVDPREPIAQSCHALDVLVQDQGPSVVEGDCATTKGSSGSVAFLRDSRGELTINALIIGGGLQDGCTFDPQKECFSYALGISQNVRARIAEFLSSVH